jgi:hypothetical protein
MCWANTNESQLATSFRVSLLGDTVYNTMCCYWYAHAHISCFWYAQHAMYNITRLPLCGSFFYYHCYVDRGGQQFIAWCFAPGVPMVVLHSMSGVLLHWQVISVTYYLLMLMSMCHRQRLRDLHDIVVTRAVAAISTSNHCIAYSRAL